MIGTELEFATVIEQLQNDKPGRLWKLKCICGKEFKATSKQITKGRKVSCGCQHKNNLLNRRYGIGTVKKDLGSRLICYSKGKPCYCKFWLVKCDCGKEYETRTSYLLSGHTQSCGCITINNRFQEIPGRFWNGLVKSAKDRKLEFDLDIEYLWELFLNQNKKCALSNVDICFGKDAVEHDSGYTTASLDRIDNNKGYIKGNVQFLHKKVNMMKHASIQKEFIDWCKLISENNK